MPVGEAQFLVESNNWIDRLYGRLVGVREYHTHFRWRAIKPVLDYGARRTLEVGANNGVMTFEFAKRARGEIVASEFESSCVEHANRIIEKGGFRNVTFIQKDLRALGMGEKFDQVLAIDVLEHIDDDMLALREINAVLDSGGRLVISVPTPNYPVAFGREFHEAIGHVRDGYAFEDLERKLRATGFRVVSRKHYTRYWASRFAGYFYKGKPGFRSVMLMLPLCKAAASLLDVFSTDRSASSLCVVAEKVRELKPRESRPRPRARAAAKAPSAPVAPVAAAQPA